MSRAPGYDVIDAEIRQLGESQKALQEAVAAARRGRDATAAELRAVQQRLTAKTHEALPHDQAIRERITTAIESAFTTAIHALTARWDEIVKVLESACRRLDEALIAAKDRLRRREELVRQAQRQTT